MRVELIIPIEALRGKLRQDGYYFRLYRGQQIVQKCPDRKGHVKTAREAENQARFGVITKMVAQMRKGGSKKTNKELWKIAADAYDSANK